MLSKKSFLADERNFSATLVRPMRRNVRDHIESQKNDHRPSYMPYIGLRRPRQRKTDLCEIFEATQLSTFSTASTQSRSPAKQQRTPGSNGIFSSDLTRPTTFGLTPEIMLSPARIRTGKKYVIV